jgi:putative colanic acid biosynthesis UDP-glucose lipid carrier transferase
MVDASTAFGQPRRWGSTDEALAPVVTCVFKRGIDFLVAAVAILLLLPLLAAAAGAIWVESAGPVLFRQRRTGLGGRTFVIFKLRTMYVLEDGQALAHATRGDRRVTRVGAFLRKTSLDELPQLLTVLRGDMSLVGPRPHAVAHDLHYGAQLPEYTRRFRARPGLTGLAQVSGFRGEIHQLDCMARRVAADVDYVERWSLGLDIKIMLKTLPLLVRDPTAY